MSTGASWGFRSDGPRCPKCDDWWRGHDALYERLDLMPHHFPAFVPHDRDASHAQVELRARLEEALSEGRVMNGTDVTDGDPALSLFGEHPS